MLDFTQNLANEIQSLAFMVLIIKALVNILLASAIARDAGQMVKRHQPVWLVSGITWAFATLVGGIWVAMIYWLVHYSQIRVR